MDQNNECAGNVESSPRALVLGQDAIYQHPLAYLLGLQGVALFRAFAGEYDRDFIEARLAEIRGLLDSAEVLGAGMSVEPFSTTAAYDGWARSYDQPGNAMLVREQVLVTQILDELPLGVALDAACGTGRHAEYLRGLGHEVYGVDSSVEMLARARAKLPDVEFREGDLHRLPLADGGVDLVVCGLALEHVPDLGPVLAEFARVLRPGGHLVISDVRGLMPGARTYPKVMESMSGELGYVAGWVHSTSEYLKAALARGFQVRGCEEPFYAEDLVDSTGTPPGDGEPAERYVASDDPPDIWSLHPWAPTATNASYRDKPSLIVWHFQLAVE